MKEAAGKRRSRSGKASPEGRGSGRETEAEGRDRSGQGRRKAEAEGGSRRTERGREEKEKGTVGCKECGKLCSGNHRQGDRKHGGKIGRRKLWQEARRQCGSIPRKRTFKHIVQIIK